MKVYKEFPCYPLIMRHYASYKDLANVIDRSVSYVNNCLNGRRSFTRPERLMIAVDMGLSVEEVFGRPEVA